MSSRVPLTEARRSSARGPASRASIRASSRSERWLGDPFLVGVLVGGQELLGVQRVARRPRQHSIDQRRVGRTVGVGGDDARNVIAVQPAQIDASGPGGAADLGQGLPERVAAMELVAAEGQHQQQTPTGGPRQRGREVLGRAVRPVHVLQHQQDRAGSRCLEDDRGEVVQHMERLPTTRCVRVQQGEHPPRRRPRPEVLEPAEEGPHRLDHRGERHARLEVETVSRRYGEPQFARPAFEVRHQRGLPDPGVAPHQHDLRGPLRGQPESLVQLGDVLLAA